MPDEPLSAYVRRTGCDEMSKDAIADHIAELERWAELTKRLSESFQVAADFQKQMRQIQEACKPSSGSLERLKASIKALGAGHAR